MPLPHTSSADLSRGPRQPLLVGVAVLLMVAGIALGALLDRALWATAQAEKPPAVVQCPACPSCPACPTTSCPPALPAPVCGPCAPATPCPTSTACPAPLPCPTCPTCGEGARGAALPLGGTLWVFEGAGWRGPIDFTTDGRYLTHWGWGRYTVSGTVLSMRNDYDGFTFTMQLDQGAMRGQRSDGTLATARFLSRY